MEKLKALTYWLKSLFNVNKKNEIIRIGNTDPENALYKIGWLVFEDGILKRTEKYVEAIDLPPQYIDRQQNIDKKNLIEDFDGITIDVEATKIDMDDTSNE